MRSTRRSPRPRVASPGWSRIPTTTILDNLYAANKIRQTIAVFVDNGGATGQDVDITAEVLPAKDDCVGWQMTVHPLQDRKQPGRVGAFSPANRSDHSSRPARHQAEGEEPQEYAGSWR